MLASSEQKTLVRGADCGACSPGARDRHLLARRERGLHLRDGVLHGAARERRGHVRRPLLRHDLRAAEGGQGRGGALSSTTQI